jgi:hypothetical protein
MLDNTQSLTINSASADLTKITQQDYTSTYQGNDTDGNRVTLTVRHTPDNKESHMVKIDRRVTDDDNITIREESAWLVMKTFTGNPSNTDLVDLTAALLAGLQASSNALLVQLAGNES